MNNYNGGLSGLVNLGNTCYMNSAIQCFSHTEKLRQYFLSKEYLNENKDVETEFDICKQWYRLMNGMWEENCTVSPMSFLKVIKSLAQKKNKNINFVFNSQNDIHEFIIFFLDNIHENLKHQVVMNVDKKKLIKLELKSVNSWK